MATLPTPQPEETNPELTLVRPRSVTEQSPGNVDKIRDILFGNQMRDYEARFGRLEESLQKEARDMRDATRRRFDSLEDYLKKELESLESRLRAESEERSEAATRLSREIRELSESLNRKLRETQESGSSAERSLRRDLLQQSQDLNDEIRSRIDQLSTIVDRRAGELRNDKADRSSLAALFTEVALRLNNEFEVPALSE
ncbi:MAG: hypothetical protein SGI92_04300 [Bryobacteraceae bacterium]|nr:hypothetical protein [Bryobacteraceae bacterium]